MLDLNYVRENLDVVRAALRKRGMSTNILDDFEREDAERRRLIRMRDEWNAQINTSSREIGALMKQGKREEAESRRAEVKQLKIRIEAQEFTDPKIEKYIRELLSTLPNIPHETVPVGKDESANVEIHRWGTKPELDFEPKDHVDLGTSLGILDLERATKITGARFAILYGAGARLERALIDFMLDLHTREHGYLETLPPFIVNRDSLFGTGQLPKFEQDLFKLEDERGFYLVPTAEVPVTNYYRDEILDAAHLPMKWTAYTPCFRSEAGSYGKDTRGVIRQHQFEKVELVKYSLPENSYDEL